jgi:alpha-tubulin suppressor-like RCC1 family protein
VSAARGYGCALTIGQELHCWGINADGELGDGTTDPHLAPNLVAGSLTIAQVSARYDHACGVTAAQAVYCWGTNDHGQLGDGTTTPRLAPTPVIQ